MLRIIRGFKVKIAKLITKIDTWGKTRKTMRFLYYLQDGIAVASLPDGYNKFYIVENTDSTSSLGKYAYPGDDIQYTLDGLCVELYDAFQTLIFPSQQEYYKDIYLQPQWITRAGLDSDFSMSKDALEKWFSTPMHERMADFGAKDENLLQIYREIETKKYRYAYTADCQSLVNTLQELLMGVHSSFVGFYKHLCSLQSVPEEDGIYFECSADTRMVFSFLFSFIVQTYSMFDILTKIAYELEKIKSCENSYAKLASSNILYGDKKKLSIDKTGTVFEKCKTTSIFENLRNELVHNATWEMSPKVFMSANECEIVERFIFLPDFTPEGTLVAYKNRKRFFADEKKVNEELPALYFDVLERVKCTLSKLLKKT